MVIWVRNRDTEEDAVRHAIAKLYFYNLLKGEGKIVLNVIRKDFNNILNNR
jgi:hypothetical protein